jgi:hypothetical protein
MTKNRFTSKQFLCAFGVFLWVLSFGASTSWGQMGSQGTVNVTVLDPTGGVVQGAKLVLQDLATNDVRSAETQQLGNYGFVTLPIGKYKLTVSKAGFENEVLNSVVVQGGRTTDVKVTLKVGSAVETVVVDASSTPLIETTSNAIATTLDIKQIEDLPLQGRDISSLAQLSPGYTGSGGFGTWNGLPLIAQTNTIDGVVSSTSRMKFAGNVQPGLEARLEGIQEMTVETGQVDLSQGMGMAAMQVNFVTRRGSNDYHGRVFEDFRNTALNANSWFNNAIGLPRNPIILNDFGGSVGGRIIKDKLFFFASFAMSKQPGGFTTSQAVLSPLAQQGIFTYTQPGPNGEAKGTTVNLFTQVAQPAGQPTCSTVSAPCQAFAAQQALITKNVGAPGAVLVKGVTDPNIDTVTWLVGSPLTHYYPAFRVDYNVSQKLRVDLSFQDTKINQPGAAAPLFPGPDFANQSALNKSSNYISSIGLNWTVTPTLINQFRGGYYYNWYAYATGATPNWAGTSPLPQVSWPICPPNFGSCSGQAFNLPVSTFYPIVNASDTATWVHKTHTVTFGFDFYREQDHYWNPPDGIQNFALGLAGGDPSRTAFDNYFGTAGNRSEAEGLYATIVGRISGIAPVGSGFPYDAKTGQYAKTPGSAYNLDELSKAWGLHASDSFRITPHFTFNYGLRWDFTGDNHDLTSAYHSADAAAIYGPSGVGNLFKPGTLTGDPNPQYVASSHQYKPWNVTPQPTIGLAWNPAYSEGFLGKLFHGGSTVIRAGFDIKRFTEPYQYFWNNASNHGLAFFQSFSLQAANGGGTGTFAPGSMTLAANQQPLPDTSFLKSPSAYAASIPESVYTWNYFWGASGFDPKIKQPYVQEWNLGIQRQLGSSNVLEVRYLGHRSVHQWIQVDPNEVNIFENGFLKEFQNAQSNLKICMANPGCASTPSFGNGGLAGQVPLPIFDAAFGGSLPSGNPNRESGGPGTFADYTNGGFIANLNQGAAGVLASQLAYPFGTVPYICNMVGSSLSPCTSQFGYSTPGTYPLNFFQVNPLGASFPGVTQSLMQASGYGDYHALQVDFRQKQWHGMQFDVNYTWSHTLGLQPENYQGSAAAWLGAVNVFSIRNLRQSYGPTNFDLRHVIHASGTFDLPVGHGKALLNRTGMIDKFVGGWTLGTIFTFETGFPFQLFGGYNTFNDYADGGLNFSGVTVSQLQHAVGVFNAPGPFKYMINPAVFGSGSGTCNSVLKGVCQNTTPGTFGGNPWLYGPHLWNDDLSLSKVVPFGEKVRFSLQAEFLNVFNHPNWGNSGNFVNSSGFGTTGVLNFTNVPSSINNGARVIELRANISF